MAKKRVMLSLDETLLERMDQACDAQGISKSAYVSMLVSKDLQDTQALIKEFIAMVKQSASDAGIEMDE